MANFAFKERSSDLNLSVDFFVLGKVNKFVRIAVNYNEPESALPVRAKILLGAFCFAAFKGPLLFFCQNFVALSTKNL